MAAFITCRIKAARAREKPREPEERRDVGRGHADPLADLVHGADDGVELQRPPGLDVLQHRRPEGAELRGDRVAILGRLRDRATDAPADRRRFLHARGIEGAHQRVGEHAVTRGAGDRRDRIHRHVAPELVPDVVADVGGVRRVEARVREEIDDFLRALAAPAPRLADDEALPRRVLHEAGLRRRGAGMHDAADHPVEGDGRRDGTIRIDARESARESVEALAEPPRNAVHRRHHPRSRAEERRDGRGDLRERGSLHGDDHQVLGAEIGRAVARAGARLQGAAGPRHAPAVAAQRLERRAARERAHLGAPRDRQLRADETADGAGTGHADPEHPDIMCKMGG
jgi:hypothetical protein